MGNSPTGTGSDPEEPDDSVPEPQPDPDQPTFDDYEPESDDAEASTLPSSAAGTGAGISVGPGAGAGAAGAGMAASSALPQDSVSENQEDNKENEDLSRETLDIDTFQEQFDSEHPDQSGDTEEAEKSDETDTEDNDDDEDQEATFVISTDPWDTTGWGNEPDLRRVEEMFSDTVSILYAPLPPRKIELSDTDSPMPTVDSPDLPDSTTTSYKALRAAAKQNKGRAYLRRLRIAVQAEGRNIEHKETLTDLAVEVGLDPDQLRNDMAEVETDGPQTIQESPQMEVVIGDVPQFWTGNIEYERICARMIGEGMKPRPNNRPLRVFVRDNALVATAEVMEAYQWNRPQAVATLENNDDISRVDLGSGEFWTTN